MKIEGTAKEIADFAKELQKSTIDFHPINAGEKTTDPLTKD